MFIKTQLISPLNIIGFCFSIYIVHSYKLFWEILFVCRDLLPNYNYIFCAFLLLEWLDIIDR